MTTKNLTSIVTILFIAILFYACSSSEESTKKKDNEGDEVYIFDEIPDNSTVDDTQDNMNYVYLIQVGAFASKLNAEDFQKISEQKLGEKLDVTFNDREKLYVVRYTRVFNIRNEAEKIRNGLWQTDDFRDAWIIKKKK